LSVRFSIYGHVVFAKTMFEPLFHLLKLHLLQLENSQRDAKKCWLIPPIILFVFWLIIAWMEGELLPRVVLLVCQNNQNSNLTLQIATRRSYWDKNLRPIGRSLWDGGNTILQQAILGNQNHNLMPKRIAIMNIPLLPPLLSILLSQRHTQRAWDFPLLVTTKIFLIIFIPFPKNCNSKSFSQLCNYNHPPP